MKIKCVAWVRLTSLVAGVLVCVAPALAAPPAVGPNVNMVSGTKWPEGDPFLTKQNEPSLAISSRNSRHLLAASNDYRLVPVEIAEELDDPEAWIQIYKSVDGGASWRATPLGGCPINIPECNDATGLTAPLKAKHPNFGADPTVRPGPYGTFFLSFIAGTRDTGANSVVAVQRFVDKNNDIQRVTDVRGLASDGRPMVRTAQDPILPDVLNIVDVGTAGQGKDKPWVAADIGRRSWNAGKTCELLSWTKGRTDVSPAAETVGAFNVYVSYANFTGQGQNEKPQIFVATSTDCGKTFGKPVKVSNPLNANQGTSSAVDPLTGAVYIVWRNFDGPDAIYMVKSTDGGQSWSKKPILVANFNAYDQGATGVSFRSLDFPSIAVSVKGGVSRVHVAWSQRKAAPAATAPYACSSANPADCDARIVMTTSLDGGNSWPAAVPIDGNVADPTFNPANPSGRGHQVQAALTFSAGKLLATWLDQRQDHTEGYLYCPLASCTNVSQLTEKRRAAKNSNLDPACHIDVSQPPLSTLPAVQKNLLDHCNNPAAVWTTYITDGTFGLVRRHTLDTYAAMADPADVPAFASNRVSQYTFGSTVQGAVNTDGTLTPAPGTYEIVQKEVSPPNLPMFSNGGSAFIGDYIDVAGQTIAATGDPAQPYKFNVGGGASGPFVTSGFAPAFNVAFTDNRDVIAPLSGDWSTPTCTTTAFTKDASGNVTGVNSAAGCGSPGYAGNRNQNVYTAAVVESSVAFAEANSKRLDTTTPRGFVVTVRNLSNGSQTYTLTLPTQSAGVAASFDKATFPAGPHKTTLNVVVQPRSTSARTVFATSGTPGAKVLVQVTGSDGYSTQLILNPDPNAPLVTNGDGTGPATDTAADNVGNVVLSNAVLTNNALSNNALTNNVLSNNALTNAVLSNVVLSNAVLSNLDPLTAALSNNVLTNNVLSNVALSNAVLSNNALSNAVLSNVVLSNNAQNAALTNLDPTNVALSNAVLSNNALTNVVLSNLDPNNALSNAMLTNNVLSNAALSNVVLSNNALSNNALSNDSLRNVVLSNAPLGDGAHGGDPDALRAIEPAATEITTNPFQTGDLANSNFKETTFTIRNRGNIDTTVAVKLMLRDAICDPNTHICATPPGYKLQLVLRKVSLVPVAIPPTGPAVSTGRAIRVGLGQVNTEVSNVTDLPLIDPNDPNLGKFLPDDPNAAILSLASGEWAYATIRAIGVGGATPPDPADLLRWGVKTVATTAADANGPLVIRTLNFPASPAFVALTQATPTFRTFGGKAPIAGSAVCSDKDGNTVLNGIGAPTSNLGADGNFYIDTAAQTIYGPKASGAWPAGTPLIVNGPSGPQASVPCPPGSIAMGAFATDASFNSTATVTFTPKYWGDFFMLANVNDASGPPPQTDRQVIKVTVLPRPPVLTYNAAFTAMITFQQSRDLAPLVSSDSPVAITFAAGPAGTCHMDPDGHTLRIDNASPPNCSVTVHQNGNETYAPVTDVKSIFIDRASQTIVFATLPVDNQLTFGNAPTTLVATTTSPTAPAGLTVTYTSTTPGICTTGGANGEVVTIAGAGTCMLTADQAGSVNYKPAPQLTPSFIIKKADQNITFGAAPSGVIFGDPPVTVGASSTSPTAPPSGILITFGTQTPAVCTTPGTSSVTIVGAGTCTITADQAGNANYNPAPQVTQSFAVSPAPTQFTVQPSYFTTLGSPTMIDGKLNRTGVPMVYPPGPANVLVQGVGTFPGTPGGADGTFTANAGSLASGTYPLTFSFGGDTNFLAATPANSTLRVEGFSATGGMMEPRTNHTSTLLGNGLVLVAGGFDPAGAPKATSELYCPDTMPVSALCPVPGAFRLVASAMPNTAARHTATLLPNGKVLVTAGGNAFAELFDPASETWTSVPGFVTVRSDHTATLLANGKVLLAGGSDGAGATLVTTMLFDPATTTFALGPPLGFARERHSATPLASGKVLLAGGRAFSAGSYTALASAEIYDPVANTFAPAGSMSGARFAHGAALLAAPDNRVVVAGGSSDTLAAPTTSLSTVEIYDETLNTWTALTPANALQQTRREFSLNRLADGWLLAAGGVDTVAGTQRASSELFQPGPGFDVFAVGASMAAARSGHAATLLPDGRVIVTGGVGAGGTAINSAELYNGP